MGAPAGVRLGELLVEAELLDEEQLLTALRVQVTWGGRLGTVLSELGFIDLETLASALGHQHGMPAALSKHFDGADRALQRMLEPEVAERYGCIPLLRAGKRIIVATTAPLEDRARLVIGLQLQIAPNLLVAAIAPELRIQYQLERVYSIPRPYRFLRARGTEMLGPAQPPTTPPFVTDDAIPEPIGVVPTNTDSERRSYVPVLGGTTPPPSRAPLHPPAHRGDTLAESVRALRCAIDRADIAALAVDAVARFVPNCHGAVMLGIRGGVAVSWSAFRRGVLALSPLALSVDDVGLARAAVRRGELVRAGSGDLAPGDYQLLGQLGLQYGDLVVTPIFATGSIRALLAVAVPAGSKVDPLPEIASAAGAAFARLLAEVSQATRARILSGDESAPHMS